MADEIDRTDKINELALAADIAKAGTITGPKPTGCCLYCSAPLVPARDLEAYRAGQPVPDGTPRWCDKDCRNDWDAEQATRKKQGLK